MIIRDESWQLKRIEELIKAGEPPDSVDVTLLGGYSRGAVCVVCSEAIEQGAPELELEWLKASGTVVLAPMHRACNLTWARAVRGARATMP